MGGKLRKLVFLFRKQNPDDNMVPRILLKQKHLTILHLDIRQWGQSSKGIIIHAAISQEAICPGLSMEYGWHSRHMFRKFGLMLMVERVRGCAHVRTQGGRTQIYESRNSFCYETNCMFQMGHLYYNCFVMTIILFRFRSNSTNRDVFLSVFPS